ncbi:hypothetical protein GCM10027037_05550 [Mucilaginibacter koreensis]
MKNYYLLYLIEQNTAVKQLLTTDTSLNSLTQLKRTNLQNAISSCKEAGCLVESMKFTDSEIKQVSSRLAKLYQPGNALGKLVQTQLIPSAAYYLYKSSAPADFLVKAWEQDAAGINYTIDVYAGGKKPNYPLIDSISFNTKRKGYFPLVYDAVTVLSGDSKADRLFFQSPLRAALLFLQLNERQDPAHYEPMAATINKAAVNQVARTNWKQYPYTALLVLGAGPDDLTTPLSAEGMLRCRLAAQSYQQKLAPFIIVSGGNAHPYKTKYNEAEEMKAYMIKVLHIPEQALIVEPHARHTTTNMRNAVRLIYRYHIPTDKPVLAVTDRLQHNGIINMAARCERELKYVPYRLGKSVDDTGVEFYPIIDAFQINPYEPLDP